MRRLMMVLPLIVVLAACGGNKQPTNVSTDVATSAVSSSTQRAVSSSTETSPLIPDLFSLLLTDQELPGWQFVPTRPTLSGPNDPCNAAVAPGTVIGDAMQDQSATYLTQGAGGPYIAEQIDRMATFGAVSGVLQKVSEAFSCKSWTESDGAGSQTDWKLEALNVGKIGQDSVAIQASQSKGTVSIGVVYMQEGSYLVSVAYLSSNKVDSSVLSDVAKKADDKVKQALSAAAP